MKNKITLRRFLTVVLGIVAFMFILPFLPKPSVYAYPSEKCPKGGSVETRGYYGCFTCGGSGCDYTGRANAGRGQIEHNGKFYSCYNCGVHSNDKWGSSYEGSSSLGLVPCYVCSYCSPVNGTHCDPGGKLSHLPAHTHSYKTYKGECSGSVKKCSCGAVQGTDTRKNHSWKTVKGECSGSYTYCTNNSAHTKGSDTRKSHEWITVNGECGGSYTYCKNNSSHTKGSDTRYGHSWTTVYGECGGSYTYCRNNSNHTQGSDSRYGHSWTTVYGACGGSYTYCTYNSNHTQGSDTRYGHDYRTTYSSDGKTRWLQCLRCSNKINYEHRLDVSSTNCSANRSNEEWFSQGTTRTVTWTADAGYHFEGTSATTTSQTVTMNAPHSVSASASANLPYTVTYNKNKPAIATSEVQGTMDNTSHVFDTASALRTDTYTLIGWRFNGWNTKADGSGRPFANGQSVTDVITSGTATLYAQWVQNDYTIEYNPNKPSTATSEVKGTTADSVHKYDTVKNLTTNGYTCAGHKFVGWNDKADGTVNSYTSGQSVKILTTVQNGTLHSSQGSSL